MQKLLLEAKNLTKIYQLGKTQVKAVDNVDFDVYQGDFLTIAGPSGSGKTTLLNLIGCLDSPTEGTIAITGQDISHLNDDQRADIRNHHIGFIFQTFNLIPVLTAYENVEFPLLLLEDIDKKERHSRIMRVLEDVGLKDQADQKPDQLSGGQRQRVAIARTLVKDPVIILADEPTANLDSNTGEMIIKLMLDFNRKKGVTFVFSTHDDMVMRHANKIVILHDGKKVKDKKIKFKKKAKSK